MRNVLFTLASLLNYFISIDTIVYAAKNFDLKIHPASNSLPLFDSPYWYITGVFYSKPMVFNRRISPSSHAWFVLPLSSVSSMVNSLYLWKENIIKLHLTTFLDFANASISLSRKKGHFSSLSPSLSSSSLFCNCAFW